MPGFEILVRPFERPQAVTKKRLVASNEKIDVTPATITFGQAGAIAQPRQVDEAGDTLNFKVIICDDKYDEQSRSSDTKRITQTLPDGTSNPDNFVDVERPYEMVFKKTTETENRTSTTAWSTAFDTAGFSTVDFNNKSCQSTYRLNRSL